MRVVLDPNVVISGLLSPEGTPALLLSAWQQGEFELTVSRALLDELAHALAYPKLRERITADESRQIVEWIETSATIIEDADDLPPVRSVDPDDNYLIALAHHAGAALVSGDQHLLELAERIPVFSPAQYLRVLEA